jgi:hypothetical protein
MKKVDIRQAITDAIDETDPSAEKMMVRLMRWAKHIERAIGSYYGFYVKAKMETITDGCKFPLPDDCRKPLLLLAGDYEDVCNAQYLNATSLVVNEDARTDDLSYIWTPLNSTRIIPKSWVEVGEYLDLIDIYEDQELTLVYQYIEKNAAGYWLVNETHIEAIKKYLIYMIAKAVGWKMLKGTKMARGNEMLSIKELKTDYSIEVLNARALDATDSPFEDAQI